MTFDLFTQHIDAAREGGMTHIVLPVSRRLTADLLTPVSAFLALRQGARYPFLLESVEGGEKLARYSFLGRNPWRTLRAAGRRVFVQEGDGPETEFPHGHLYDALKFYTDTFKEVRMPGLPRLTGGAVGFAGYDTVRLIEHLPHPATPDLGLPDGMWGFYQNVVAFDHVRHQMVLMHQAFVHPETDLRQAFDQAEQALNALQEDLARPFTLPKAVKFEAQTSTSNLTRERFDEMVTTAKRHIYEGDIFQVVLSQRFETPFEGDPFYLYRALRQINPSPYLFFLDFGAFALVGSSPEVLVRVEDGRAELLPIAGTRPRGATPEADLALERELSADAKERAEHLMLVDLGRNDLGRVCAFGSVQVDRYAFVERYSHVMHIVSSVSGRVAEDRHPVDVLAASFPAGTVSGAPKVRAMQIIDALEPTRRGPYAGAVGYIDYSGNLDTCIAIRTMVVKSGKVYVQAGAGIVADSNADAEFQETVNKAGALQQAIATAAQALF